jgi:hypothetical protein
MWAAKKSLARGKVSRKGIVTQGENMRKTLAIALSVVGGVLAMAGPLLAHHAASSYDNTREIKLEGIVTEFRMVNPHPQLYFTVKGPDGIEEWFGESQSPPYRWFNNGWKANTIKAGDAITVIGRPSREAGRKRVNITKIFGPNGAQYPPKEGRVGPLD